MRKQASEVLSLEDRTCCDSNVVLFHRLRSQKWQARIRRTSGVWFILSTGTTDFESAKFIATERYNQLVKEPKEENNSFQSVARATIKQLQTELDSGIGKVTYLHYIRAINKYLIPAFNKTPINKVDETALLKLDIFRMKLLGRVPNRNTVNCHNVALNYIFDTAVRKGYMLRGEVPELHNKGSKANARPYFDETEFAVLTKRLDEWATIGRKEETRYTRAVLRDYVAILSATGIRTGREASTIKWNWIRRMALAEGVTGLQISVNGKTGKRTLIAKDADGVVTKALMRIASMDPLLANLSLDELLLQDVLVFRTLKGQRIKHARLGKHFQKCLVRYGLVKNGHGETRTLYSLRHMHATFQILHGVDMATLAVQMGTSIAMLEKHYSKLKPYMKASMLHGAHGIPVAQSKLGKMVEEQSVMIHSLLGKLSERVN